MEELDVPFIDDFLTWHETRTIYLRSGVRLRKKYLRLLFFYTFVALFGIAIFIFGLTALALGDRSPHSFAMLFGPILAGMAIPAFVRDTSECFDGVNF